MRPGDDIMIYGVVVVASTARSHFVPPEVAVGFGERGGGGGWGHPNTNAKLLARRRPTGGVGAARIATDAGMIDLLLNKSMVNMCPRPRCDCGGGAGAARG